MTALTPLSALGDSLLEDAYQGDSQAQFRLAQSYQSGNGRPVDLKKAATWLLMAAVQGHTQAQFHLGNAYHSGQGVPQLTKRAAHWWYKAALQGHAEAQSRYGITLQQVVIEPLKDEELDVPPSETVTALSEPILTPIKKNPETSAAAAQSLTEKLSPEAATDPKSVKSPIPRVSTKKYHTTSPEAVAPVLRAECAIWLAKAPEEGYLIQLIATHRLSSVMTYLEHHTLQDTYSLCAYDQNNTLWFTIFYGHYPDIGSAKTGLNALPESLKRSQPYYRNLNKIRQLVRRPPSTSEPAN